MGLLGTINILPMYTNLVLGIKSSTLPKKSPRKAVTLSVEVRGEELAGAGRTVRLVLLSFGLHTPPRMQRSASPAACPCLASIPANAAVGHLLLGLGISGISADFPSFPGA